MGAGAVGDSAGAWNGWCACTKASIISVCHGMGQGLFYVYDDLGGSCRTQRCLLAAQPIFFSWTLER